MYICTYRWTFSTLSGTLYYFYLSFSSLLKLFKLPSFIVSCYLYSLSWLRVICTYRCTSLTYGTSSVRTDEDFLRLSVAICTYRCAFSLRFSVLFFWCHLYVQMTFPLTCSTSVHTDSAFILIYCCYSLVSLFICTYRCYILACFPVRGRSVRTDDLFLVMADICTYR